MVVVDEYCSFVFGFFGYNNRVKADLLDQVEFDQ